MARNDDKTLNSRELDAKVAEKVMGWERRFNCDGNDGWRDADGNVVALVNMFEPSTSVAQAFNFVVEKMRERLGKGWSFTADTNDGFDSGPEWRAIFSRFGPKSYQAESDSLPEAICLAALRAVEGEG